MEVHHLISIRPINTNASSAVAELTKLLDGQCSRASDFLMSFPVACWCTQSRWMGKGKKGRVLCHVCGFHVVCRDFLDCVALGFGLCCLGFWFWVVSPMSLFVFLNFPIMLISWNFPTSSEIPAAFQNFLATSSVLLCFFEVSWVPMSLMGTIHCRNAC